MSSWLGNISFESISFKVLHGFSMSVSQFPSHIAALTHPSHDFAAFVLPCGKFAASLMWSQAGGHSGTAAQAQGSGSAGWCLGNVLDTHLEEASLGCSAPRPQRALEI